MKSPLIAALLAIAAPATGLLAADATVSATASVQASASTSPAQPAPAPNKIIYAARLPTPQEIATSAASQGLVVGSIAQTGSDITVVYDLGQGRTNTVSYQLLPSAGAPAAPSTVVAAPTATPAPSPTPAPTVIYAQQPATQVIYTSPAPVYYDSGYYPYYYPPVVVGFGFGWHGGWRGGWRH